MEPIKPMLTAPLKEQLKREKRGTEKAVSQQTYLEKKNLVDLEQNLYPRGHHNSHLHWVIIMVFSWMHPQQCSSCV